MMYLFVFRYVQHGFVVRLNEFADLILELNRRRLVCGEYRAHSEIPTRIS